MRQEQGILFFNLYFIHRCTFPASFRWSIKFDASWRPWLGGKRKWRGSHHHRITSLTIFILSSFLNCFFQNVLFMICIKKKQVPGGTTMHPCQVVEQLVLTLPNIFISQPQTHTHTKQSRKNNTPRYRLSRKICSFWKFLRKNYGRTDGLIDGWMEARKELRRSL